MRKVLIVIQLIKYMVVMTATIIQPNESNNKHKDLISHGELFDIQQYPFMVFFEFRKLNRRIGLCTGSLILPLFVLTAAHCTEGLNKYSIMVYRYSDENKIFNRNVKHIYQHQLYDESTAKNDISLLRLRYPFQEVSHYLRLSGHPDEFSNATNLTCTAIGYGITEQSSNTRNSGYMTNISVMHGLKECQFHLIPSTQIEWELILCSEPNIHNACPGDSGGPLICNGFQYGIANFIYNAHTPKNTICGDPHIQTGFLFVHFYRDWIHNTILNTGNHIQLYNKLFNVLVILLIYNWS